MAWGAARQLDSRRDKMRKVIMGGMGLVMAATVGWGVFIQLDENAIIQERDAADLAVKLARQSATEARSATEGAGADAATVSGLAKETRRASESAKRIINSVLKRKTDAEEAATTATLTYYALPDWRRDFEKDAALTYVRALNRERYIKKQMAHLIGWFEVAIKEVDKCAERAEEIAGENARLVEVSQQHAARAEEMVQIARESAEAAHATRWLFQVQRASKAAQAAAVRAQVYASMSHETINITPEYLDLAKGWNERNHRNKEKIVAACAPVLAKLRRAL